MHLKVRLLAERWRQELGMCLVTWHLADKISDKEEATKNGEAEHSLDFEKHHKGPEWSPC